MGSSTARNIHLASDIVRTRSVEEGAVLYLLRGQGHFVPAGSERERSLVAQGALAIGLLRFDADPEEAFHPGATVQLLGSRAAAELFGARPGSCAPEPRNAPTTPQGHGRIDQRGDPEQ